MKSNGECVSSASQIVGGAILGCLVHAGDGQDRDGAKVVLGLIRKKFLRIRFIWADGCYRGKLLLWVSALFYDHPLKLEIVERSDQVTGFHVLPRRWVVEHTFALLGGQLRLSEDYEFLTSTSEAIIRVAMTGLMLRRFSVRGLF